LVIIIKERLMVEVR